MKNVKRKIFSNKCREKERAILFCSLGVVASHRSLFPVSYRWRAESYYKGCHPSGPPAHANKTQTRKRAHSCSVYKNGGGPLAARGCHFEVIKAPDGGGSAWGCKQGVTHSSPDGDAIFLSVAEVVGFKWVPIGEDNRRVVGPLEVHLHVSVVEPEPELVDVWQETQIDHQLRNTNMEIKLNLWFQLWL